MELNERPDMITVIEKVHFRPYSGDVISEDNRFNRILSGTEQPYIRNNHVKSKATEVWQKIDFGWLDTISMFVVANDEGLFFEGKPSEEEKEDSNKRIIEVGLSSETIPPEYPLIIPPTEALRFCFDCDATVWIRCRYKDARWTLSAFPK